MADYFLDHDVYHGNTMFCGNECTYATYTVLAFTYVDPTGIRTNLD